MARYLKTFTASSSSALISAANAWLATLVNPLNPLIHQVSLEYTDKPSRNGGEYFLAIHWEDTGALLATAFTLDIVENRYVASLEQAVNVIFAASPAAFFYAKAGYADSEGKLIKYLTAIFSNVAGGASANWLAS